MSDFAPAGAESRQPSHWIMSEAGGEGGSLEIRFRNPMKSGRNQLSPISYLISALRFFPSAFFPLLRFASFSASMSLEMSLNFDVPRRLRFLPIKCRTTVAHYEKRLQESRL